MRIAIVIPWYVANGGAEKVDGVLAEMYPEADFYALFSKECGIPAKLQGKRIHNSFLQYVPYIEKCYQPLLFTFPCAVESFDLRGYDLVISSDWACTKGVLTDPETVHICYCHSPMRHIWDLYQMYIDDAPRWKRPIYGAVAQKLRLFDFQAAQRVDSYIANSSFIAKRIEHYYRRSSTVIYPPVDMSNGYIANSVSNYYLSVGRLNRTKRLDLLIKACNQLQRKLIVSGWGPEEQSLKSIAGPSVEFVGRVPDKELPALYAHCRALLFAADEDFGIVPVEAQSYGRPVIAYGHGGSLETVRVGDSEGRPDTGVFFAEQTVESLVEGILRFESREGTFIPMEIQEHAMKFQTSAFIDQMRLFVESAMRKDKLVTRCS